MSVHLKDFSVGQTAYVSGWQREAGLTEVTVKRVGRKYVTVGKYSYDEHRFEENPYYTNSLKEVSQYGAPASLYKSKEDYDAACEDAKLRRWIDNELPNIKSKLNCEQLQAIKDMVNGFLLGE